MFPDRWISPKMGIPSGAARRSCRGLLILWLEVRILPPEPEGIATWRSLFFRLEGRAVRASGLGASADLEDRRPAVHRRRLGLERVDLAVVFLEAWVFVVLRVRVRLGHLRPPLRCVASFPQTGKRCTA